MRSSPLVVVGVSLTALAACGGGTPAPSTAPTPTDATASAPAASAAVSGASRFTWSPGRRAVEVRTEAVVTRDTPAPAPPAGSSAMGASSAGAASAASERITSNAYLTADLAAADAPGATAVSGTVDSLVVAAVGGTPAPTTLIAGFRYHAASDARGVRVEAADPATDLRCTATTGGAALSALAAVREALPRIPADLAAGAQWRDPTVTASCAGPVLLVAQTIAQYESAADPGTPGRLRVTRQSTTAARGTGAAGIRPMTVVASGTARSVYALDPARGQLVDGSGEGRTAVTITVSGVAQRFTQQTRTQLVVR